jgi:hypothetical protein
MTESNPLAATVEVLLGHKTFDLKIISWRQFRYGASYGGGRADYHHLDDHQIEVHCRSQGGTLREGTTTVGGNPPQDMHGLRFTIVLRSAQKMFAAFDGDACARYHEAWQGYFQYFEPIGPKNTIDGKGEAGSVHGVVFLGNDTIREISRILTFRPEHDICLGLTVKATATPTENAMIYSAGELYEPTTYHWDGKNWLHITEAVVVTKGTPASEEPKSDEAKETDEEEPPPQLPTSRQSTLGIGWGLLIAWLVYETVMGFGSIDPLSWSAGSLGPIKWPAGSLGPGSGQALWLGFLAFVLCQWIASILGRLLRAVDDQRAIRGHLMAIAWWLRRRRQAR